ncbi:hypothetical protein K0M31_017697 [Melipona bicolor]|uniref:Uncharacterized protein n=1 Tax=Melipona bicolor TaxID=60889 RepID=A0AA40KSS7_9HYME|nr:hypothetical protein K0M31_017697 [Melipona bicolor]
MALQAGGEYSAELARKYESPEDFLFSFPSGPPSSGPWKRERRDRNEDSKLQRRNVEAGRLLSPPEIFPCDLIAGKESSRAHDEERCPAVYCKSKGNRPTDEWYSRHSERSRQTDEITAQRSIIECPFDVDDDDDDDDDDDGGGDEQDRD